MSFLFCFFFFSWSTNKDPLKIFSFTFLILLLLFIYVMINRSIVCCSYSISFLNYLFSIKKNERKIRNKGWGIIIHRKILFERHIFVQRKRKIKCKQLTSELLSALTTQTHQVFPLLGFLGPSVAPLIYRLLQNHINVQCGHCSGCLGQ